MRKELLEKAKSHLAFFGGLNVIYWCVALNEERKRMKEEESRQNNR